MTTALYSHGLAALVAAAIAGAGAWQVQDWRFGQREAERLRAEQQADELRQADARQQRQLNDRKAGEHAAFVAGLNTQLGDAHALIAKLSDRRCLDRSTVGVLNAIGKPAPGDVRANPGDAAGEAPAAARSADDGEGASERDTAEHIALCRARYAEVSSQLNKILDIEERRDAARAQQ